MRRIKCTKKFVKLTETYMEYWVQPALKWLHFERSPGNEVLIDVLLYDVYIELALGLIQLMPIALSDMWNIPCG